MSNSKTDAGPPDDMAEFERENEDEQRPGGGPGKTHETVVAKHERRVARSRKHWRFEVSDESEEWVISYMDMVTLIMCAFVVIAALLDIQSTHTPQPVTDAPRGNPPVSSTVQVVPPISPAAVSGEEGGTEDEGQPSGSNQGGTQVGGPGEGSKSGSLMSGTIRSLGAAPAAGTGQTAVALQTPAISPEEAAADAKFEEAWRQAIAAQGLADRVSISARGRSVTIQIQDEILFPTGQAELERGGHDVIRRLAPLLGKTAGEIRVEGHTDNVPIDNDRFASNWELSAGRATSVVRALIDAGIAPVRLRATGYADTRPVLPNDNDSDRARNRRVSLIVER